MIDYELNGKTAIVTGGSDGLGRAAAKIISSRRSKCSYMCSKAKAFDECCKIHF